MHTTIEIEPTQAVNEITVRFPATLQVFQHYGIDACCGGAKPLAEVATRHGHDLDALLADLRTAAARGG
jgi:regulator of cell morphogenesis and NO signaling